MIRSLLLIAAVIGLMYTINYVKKLPAAKRKKFILKFGLYAVAIVIIGLVLAGKVHWIAAGFAALLPIMQKLFYTGMRLMPFLKYWQSAKQQYSNHQQQSSPTATSGKMTVKEAQEIMGLKTVESVAQVSKRHKELMQKNHPDRGGSDFLAAQINQAKETLVDHLKS